MEYLTLNRSSSEVFVPCLGYEGLYEVGDLGTVRSVDKPVYDKFGEFRYIKVGITLLKEVTKTGYLRVTLSNNGVVKKELVHRLVCKAFLGDSDLQVNHKDGVKDNNALTNLEWMTQSENSIHRLYVLDQHKDMFIRDEDFRRAVASEYIYKSRTCGAIALASKYGVGKQTIYNWVEEFKNEKA